MSYRPATVQGAKYRKDWESTSRLDPDSVTVGGGAWPGHTPAHQVPPVWRAPEGPEGTGGLRDDAPSEARGADGSRAGRRPRAHKAARPHSRGLRRPEHQRRHRECFT